MASASAQQPELQDLLFASLIDPFCGLYMAQTAEKVAKKRLRHHARGAGRVRAAQPRARRGGRQGGSLRRGNRALRHRDAQGRARHRHGRPHQAGHVASRRSRSCAPPSARRDGDGRQRERDRGRRRGARDDQRGAREGRRPRHLGQDRSWATVGVDPSEMGIGPVPAIIGSASSAPVSVRRRGPLRDQRGLRRPVPRLREGARARPRQVSTSTAARSRWATRSAPPVRASALDADVPAAPQRASVTAWPPPASAAGRASRCSIENPRPEDGQERTVGNLITRPV